MELQGVDLDQAIKALRELAQDCENLLAALSGPRVDARGKYMDWATRCEGVVRNIYADPASAQAVYSERYWHIAESAVIDRQAQVIESEIRFQILRLTGMAARLRGYLQLRDRTGVIAVVDTNVLLYFQRVDLVPWAEVVGRGPVRLVIPLIVLDELDGKKYLGRADLRERARSALKPLDEMQAQFERSGHAVLPGGTTLEYLLDDPGHQRLTNPDEEVLDRAAFLGLVTGQEVAIVTGDRGMRVRASARPRLRAVAMPERFSKDQEGTRQDAGSGGGSPR